MPDRLDVAIGAAIRLRRVDLGMSQSSLAEACGVTFQQIQKYEGGLNRISFSKLVRLAQALDCRVQSLIGDIDKSDDSARVQMEISQLAATPGADHLLRAYATIPETFRRPVVQLLDGLVVGWGEPKYATSRLKR